MMREEEREGWECHDDDEGADDEEEEEEMVVVIVKSVLTIHSGQLGVAADVITSHNFNQNVER